MKSVFLGTLAVLAGAAAAVPTFEPEGGWESIDWTKVKYPPGTGENLPNYPAPPGGWENVKYPPGTGAGAGGNCANGPFTFTSTFNVVATPDQVVNGTEPTGGLEGALGYYNFGINSELDMICYHIRLINFRGKYESPADTATHIHEAGRGESGPPRLAFPNPVKINDNERVSMGCLTGPFTTGLPDETTGEDSGVGFKVAEIEANPAGFMADVHSSQAVPGAVRGQIA